MSTKGPDKGNESELPVEPFRELNRLLAEVTKNGMEPNRPFLISSAEWKKRLR